MQFARAHRSECAGVIVIDLIASVCVVTIGSPIRETRSMSKRTSVSELWRRFDAWLAEHAPARAERLRPGASAAAIAAAEARLGLAFPADVREGFACHDGDDEAGIIGDWSLMSRGGALDKGLLKRLAKRLAIRS